MVSDRTYVSTYMVTHMLYQSTRLRITKHVCPQIMFSFWTAEHVPLQNNCNPQYSNNICNLHFSWYLLKLFSAESPLHAGTWFGQCSVLYSRIWVESPYVAYTERLMKQDWSMSLKTVTKDFHIRVGYPTSFLRYRPILVCAANSKFV